MNSTLQILAALEEDEHAAIDFDRIRLRVGPSDRAAGRELIAFLNECEKRKVTYGTGELMLVLRLGLAIADLPDEGNPERILSNPAVRGALDSLFWFHFHEQMVSVPQPPLLDIRSVWVRRPQPYVHGAPLWQTVGITVDEMIGHKRPMWAIKAGQDDVLGKDGEWELQPMPSSRTPEFFERTRWDDFDAALAFAQAYVEKEDATPDVAL